MFEHISIQPHCFVPVVGPAGSVKSRLIGRMFGNQEQMISSNFDKLIFFCKHYQQHYENLLDCEFKNADIDFVQGLVWNYLQKAEAQKKNGIR